MGWSQLLVFSNTFLVAYAQKKEMLTYQSVLDFRPDSKVSTAFSWISMKDIGDINLPLRINPTDFYNALTFPIEPPAS